MMIVACALAAVPMIFAQGPGGGPFGGGPAMQLPGGPGGPGNPGGPGGPGNSVGGAIAGAIGSAIGGAISGAISGSLGTPAPAPNPVAAPLPNPVPAPLPEPAPAPPVNAVQCMLNGITYWVANGLFYHLASSGNGYVSSSTPPLGLIVPSISNAIQISWAGYPAYLSHHVVYRPVWTNGGREFKVVGYLG